MLAPSESTSRPRHPLSWLRFSLRTLLLVITAIAVIGGWPLGRAVRQRAAIRHFYELTSHLPPEHFYDHYLTISYASSGDFYEAGRPPSIPVWRTRLYLFVGGHECWGKVTGVRLSHAQVTNDDLRFLAGLSHLAELELAGTAITNDGLARLHEFPKLRYIDLAETSISDDGLAHLAALTQLQALSLDRTAITDSGLKHLESLERLESLTLRKTAVTDACVPHLAKLQRLTELFLTDTAVTERGYQTLQAALPNCRIRGTPAGSHD